MSNTKKYYWLKLKEDFFRDKRMKKLRTIAGGDTYTIIYLKMQLLSLKNSGILIFEGIEDTIEEELALDIDEAVDDVKVCVTFLLNSGLIEYHEGEYIMVQTQQCIGSESDSAERMRRLRQKKKETKLLEEPSQCDNDVQTCDIEIDKRDKKEELREKIKRDEKKEKISDGVSVSEEQLEELFARFEITDIYDQNNIIEYVNNGMTIEVIEKALMLPFNRNVDNFNFDIGMAPIDDPIRYGLKVLENWNNFGVRTLSEAKQYNKVFKGVQINGK